MAHKPNQRALRLGKVQPESPSVIQEEKKTEEELKQETKKHNLLWKLMSEYTPADKISIQSSFVAHLEYTLARSRFNFDLFSAYLATSYSVRNRLIELFNDTMEFFISKRAKQIYYISIEFLMGRFLRNALLNLEIENSYKESLEDFDLSLDDIYNEEYDPGLGNGGLGRLAACFVDSLATLNYPGWGYGLMYSFGMFKQAISGDGSQFEIPDYWLSFGDPWRVQKPTIMHTVGFYGHIDNGVWYPSLRITAVANDFLIPGYGTDNTLALRLWNSRPTSELDEEKFRFGDYYDAVAMKQRCENLTSVLYPNDNTPEGKEMRLMQEYFLSSATLQDIFRRLKKQFKAPVEAISDFAAIQLNDTHPAIMVAEFMRLMMDVEKIPFDKSFEICQKVFSYTCHTLMPEALEKWSVPLFESLLPRHLEIIYQINYVFLTSKDIKIQPEDLSKVSIIEESSPKMIRMANLCVIGSHKVNGVAEIHSQLMKEFVFNPFYKIWPDKFINKTNGVTVRRWVHHCNTGLSELITKHLGNDAWVKNADELKKLIPLAKNEQFCFDWRAVKLANKQRLAKLVKDTVGVDLDPTKQLFDIQVKRIHEYKRQTLNILGVIDRYLQILSEPSVKKTMVPRAIIFGGKAAPGYYAAKKLIKLVNNVSRVVNEDIEVGDLMKVVFIPNYNVSVAEIIIPGTDLSQHISTAGTEASGTSNMKFAFNAGLIIGTHDGANIEIGQEIGNDNVFFFGAKADEVPSILKSTEKKIPERLQTVFRAIRSSMFGDPDEYESLLYPIEHGDPYLVAHDFEMYQEAQKAVDAAYKKEALWTKKCILSTANMGKFSSDRTINEYAKEVWGISPLPLPVSTISGETNVVRRHNPEIGSAGSTGKASMGSLPKDYRGAPKQQPQAPVSQATVDDKAKDFW